MPLGTWNFRNFKQQIFVDRKAPIVYTSGFKCLRRTICNRKRKKKKNQRIGSNLPSIKIGTYYTHGPNTLLLIKHGSVQLPGLGSKTVVVLVNCSLLGESTNETIYSKKKRINLGFWETAHLPLP